MDSNAERIMQNREMIIYVMGVSGCGKSTIGKALSASLGIPFLDGDDLHPVANIKKMSLGIPLTDNDRYPWLENIRVTAQDLCTQQKQQHPTDQKMNGVVIACSALKREYRDLLRGNPSSLSATTATTTATTTTTTTATVNFVYLKGTREVLLERMSSRQGHFMKAVMLDSQLNTLESPEGEEGVITVSIEDTVEDQIRCIEERIGLE